MSTDVNEVGTCRHQQFDGCTVDDTYGVTNSESSKVPSLGYGYEKR